MTTTTSAKPKRARRSPRNQPAEEGVDWTPPKRKAAASTAAAPAEFEWVDWRALRPWPGNPKTYSADEVAELARSVMQNGWGRPGVANRHPGLEGEIIEGHRSRLVAEQLGDQVVPGAPGPFVLPMRWVSLPPKRAHALALAGARIPKSEMDQEKLKGIVRSHELDPTDWVTAGFAEAEIRALTFDPWPEDKPEKSGKDDEPAGLTYSVMIECRDEQQQTEILEWCEQQGIAGKPWVG